MSKKQPQLPNKQFSMKKEHVIKLLLGIFLIAAGLCFNWDISDPEAIPDWINTQPGIVIGAEKFRADIDVACYVKENGIIVLTLSGGDRLDEPVRVLVNVQDECYPFYWEIRNGMFDNILLAYADSDEASTSDYPVERMFISQKTGQMVGVSREYSSENIYSEYFTTVIAPGEESCELMLQMEPEHTECQIDGDIIIRMPCITSLRSAPAYDMNISDIYAAYESGDYNIMPYITDSMIDGNFLFEADLDITGGLFSKYVTQSNYVVESIQPNPEILFPSCGWHESLQWLPYVAFHDYNYDRRSFIFSWIGGVFITIGSGLLVIPLSDRIQSMEK